MAIIFGLPPGPYVRKVMLAHAHKQIEFSLKRTSPGSDDPDFRSASPLGKIPAYQTDTGAGFSDSSVIIAYLERTSNNNPLYPENNDDFGQALWLEEYADTKMSDATNALYFQRVLGPKFFSQVTDEARVEEIITQLLPPIFDYLETIVTPTGWIFGHNLSVADLTIGSNLISLFHADFAIDAKTWPQLAQFSARFLNLEMVQKHIEVEQSIFAQA